MRTKKSHNCQNNGCENRALKDKYGNYKRYCSGECRTIGTENKFRDTYSKKDMNAILEKRKETTIERYGIDNVSKRQDVREKLSTTTRSTAKIRNIKTRETNLARYGVESTNSLEEVLVKRKATIIEKYGVDHPLKVPEIAASVSKKNSENSKERMAKAKETKLEVYGNEHYNNRAKYTETCVERFGVGNPSQSAEIHEKKIKNSYKSKKFVFPSGREVYVRGYEPEAIMLLLEKYRENDIITETSQIPFFTYFECDGSRHIYFPDIYIPKDNLIIEVKSEYTYRGFIGWYETNLLKEKSVRDAGYDYRLMIMAKK